MPLIAFVDNELEKKIEEILKEDNNDNKDEIVEYPEYEFLAMCLRANIPYEYLEKFTYVDIMKILYSFINNKGKKQKENIKVVRKATQADIDRFLM